LFVGWYRACKIVFQRRENKSTDGRRQTEHYTE
jgi:hypothetical protein